MTEYIPPQFRVNLQAFSISSRFSQKKKAKKFSAWLAMQGKQSKVEVYFYELMVIPQKSTFFQSRFSSFFLVKFHQKFLYKKQRTGIADTAKEYPIYLDSD